MQISSIEKVPVSGVMLKIGKHNYPEIDHKDPSTAMQLKIFRDEAKIISFREILAGDKVDELKTLAKRIFPRDWPTKLLKLDIGSDIPSKVFNSNEKTRRIDFDKVDDNVAAKMIVAIKGEKWVDSDARGTPKKTGKSGK